MTTRASSDSGSQEGARSSGQKRRWYRFLPFLGFHHVLMICLVIVIILLAILIAGCTSESLSSVYLLSLSYANDVPEMDATDNLANASSTMAELAANHTSLEVRAGYMGMCLMVAGQAICSRGQDALEAYVLRTVLAEEVGDPLNLIYAAARFRSEVVFVAFLFVGIIFAFLASILVSGLLSWRRSSDSGARFEAKPLPSRSITWVSLVAVLIASILSLVGSFWQHLSSAAASTMASIFTYGNIVGHVGPGAMALGWISTFFLFLVTLGLLTKIIAINLLTELSR